LSGITNSLLEAYDLKCNEKNERSFEKLDKIRNRFVQLTNEIFEKPNDIYEVQKTTSAHFHLLYKLLEQSPNQRVLRNILSYGEIITSEITAKYMLSLGFKCKLINAVDFMRIDRDREPDYYYIQENLNRIISENDARIFITQGFICKNFIGETDNLNRGGSDKSATIIGNVLKSDRVEIWSDKDGILNNDPRCVANTYSLDSLSYEEAEELASFGAKILHPSCLKPARESRLKVILKNTFNPGSKGTIISDQTEKGTIKAVAAKDNVTVIKISSSEMLMAYGFLSKIFQVFEFHKTPVDMIATSEVNVAVSIDDSSYLEDILHDLNKFSKTKIFKNQTIVSIVGNIPPEDKGIVFQIFESIKEIPIRMISYGAGSRSVCLLINSFDKINALNLINDKIFFNHLTNEHQYNNTEQNNTGILV